MPTASPSTAHPPATWTGRLRIIAIILGGIIVAAIIVVVSVFTVRYESALRAAIDDYESTHAPFGHDGDASWVTLGVQYGDSVATVNDKLRRASESIDLRDHQNPNPNGSARLYTIDYGPPLTNPDGTHQILIFEQVTTYFDERGKATHVHVWTLRENAEPRDIDVELKTGRVIRRKSFGVPSFPSASQAAGSP